MNWEILKTIREGAGYEHIKDGANAVGISPGYLGEIEAGKRPKLQLSMLERIAKAYGRSLEINIVGNGTKTAMKGKING